MLGFSFTAEQKELKENAIEFARKTNSDNMWDRDKESVFNRELWTKYAKFGAHGAIVPKEFGGLELDFISSVAIMEGLGYAANDNGLLFSINAHIWSCIDPILHFGNSDQKRRYLPGLCNGEIIGVHAMTEPESGSDAFSLKTTATKVGEQYKINGSKLYITNGTEADIILVFAKTQSPNGNTEISCILVESNNPGLSRSKNIEKMGLRTSPFCQLFFDDCLVSQENIIGAEGIGKEIFSNSMDGERAFILATQVGAMERQLEECVKFSRMRKQFDKQIFEFQSISNKLADMKVKLETSRLLLYKVAWLHANGRNATQESAMAKLYISESAVENSMSAMRISGGVGYTTEMGQERMLRDSFGGLFYSGTSDIMRNIISGLLD